MKIKGILITLAFFAWLGMSQVAAQERITITDPDLSFSYILNEGWSSSDDPYYHYIEPPCSESALSLTYFEGRCLDIKDCFEATTKGAFPNQYLDYAIVDEGVDLVEGGSAPWITFKYFDTETNKDGYGYYTSFIRLNQQFTLKLETTKDCLDQEQKEIQKLVKSLKIKAN